jgi:hypothetical protein
VESPKKMDHMKGTKMITDNDDIIMIPDLLPKSYQDEIEREMTSLQFPWYYKHSVSGHPSAPEVFKNDSNIKARDALVHLFYAEDINYVSNHISLVKPITYFLEQHTGASVQHLLRMRAVLTYRDPSWNQEHYLTPHVDQQAPHWTMIYYVNDCDGPTHFYEDFFDKDNNYNKRTLKSSHIPKKGTGVLFNGLRYHGNSVGNEKNRVVINMNMQLNFNYTSPLSGEVI